MSLALIMPDRNGAGLVKRLQTLDSQLDVQIWPAMTRPQDVRMAVCWQPPAAALTSLLSLELVQSLGAGVDGLVESIPAGVTLCRTVSPSLKSDMRDYVLLAILAEQRQWAAMATAQRARQWQPQRYRRGGTVGIMGLGELGQAVTQTLAGLGFTVKGWSRQHKTLAAVECFAGSEQLPTFLAGLDYLVCLLPLTADTHGLMNHTFFQQLTQPTYLIQVGRGQQLVESDLLYALEQGQLRGACLDVFASEPLPTDSTLWQQPGITITPHCASITSGKELAAAIYKNYQALLAGQAPAYPVDLTQGY